MTTYVFADPPFTAARTAAFDSDPPVSLARGTSVASYPIAHTGEPGSAALSSDGALSAAGSVSGSAAMASDGALTAIGSAIGSAALASDGALSASGAAAGIAALVADGALAASGQVSGSADLTADGALSAAGTAPSSFVFVDPPFLADRTVALDSDPPIFPLLSRGISMAGYPIAYIDEAGAATFTADGALSAMGAFPPPIFTAIYDDDLARVILTASHVEADTVTILRWDRAVLAPCRAVLVRGTLEMPVLAPDFQLFDYEFTPGVENTYTMEMA